MSTLLEKARQLPERFDGLSSRERIMILILVLAVVAGVWFNLLWYPQTVLQGQLKNNLNQLDEQIRQLDNQLTGMVERAEQDPNVKIKQELAELRRFVAEMEKKIKGTTEALIEPREMAQMLESMLLSNRSLKLLRLSTLKTEPLMGGQGEPSGEDKAKKDDSDKVAENNIYLHPFTLEFEGSYLAVLNYLKALERLPGRFFWDGIELVTADYPIVRVKLQLHTLSLSEGWIGV